MLSIPLSKPDRDFSIHLSQDDNERIIFSGRFGSGKTYFLNHFFDKNKNYQVIHLFPINYTVSQNEDIFELIKYDIIIELLKLDFNLEKISINKLLTFQFYLINNPYEIVKSIFEGATKVGKTINPAIAGGIEGLIHIINNHKPDYEKFHRDSQVDEKKALDLFLNEIKNKQGNIYEDDNLTGLIKDIIRRYKNENPKKEVVLIIDDMDRIDPDHIFRILNVFSAHFDLNNPGNKFLFDKVVIVCDIENIRNIFHAKYGVNVDFSGYIDKFYSKEIFKFDNSVIILEYIDLFIDSLHISDPKTFPIQNTVEKISRDLKYIINSMVIVNAITLRSLSRHYQKKYEVKNYSFKIGEEERCNNNFAIILIFDFLKYLFGSEHSLNTAIEKCCTGKAHLKTFLDKEDTNHHKKLGDLIPILDFSNFKHTIDENLCRIKSDFEIVYVKSSYNNFEYVEVKNIKKDFYYFEILDMTFKELISLNLFKN